MGKIGKRVLEGQTREDRQKVRKQLGSLRSLTVSEKTRSRYDVASSKFFGWLDENELTLPRKREQLDGLLAEYIEHLWTDGAGRAQACDTLAGLQDRDPKLKGHLQLSWRLLRTWSTNEIPKQSTATPPGGGFGYGRLGLFSWSLQLRCVPTGGILLYAEDR